jgi:tetratricopeptide (TPR) repeat protein
MGVTTAGRFALLFGARLLGRAIAILRHPVVANLLLLAAVTGLLAGLDWAVPGAAGPWLTTNRAVGVWALLLVAWWVMRQRRRLLVARFDDMTGEKPGAQGLSLLLASELTQLRDLFAEFEDGRVIQTTADEASGSAARRAQLFDATVQVDAQGAFLDSAISAEGTLAVGPLRIPVNVVLALVNRLVQGPRLGGQVQVDGGRRIVTVELTARRLHRQWRVEDEGAERASRPLAVLAHEMGLRIFADLAFDRPVRWTAVGALVEGLRAYRRTLRTTKEGRLNLRQAERHLLDAITEDNRFDLAYYNLGVVYTALNRLEAALSVFARSIELDPDRFAGHYALARVRYALALSLPESQAVVAARHLRFALDHGEQAVALADSAQARAKALNTQALAQMQLGGLEFFDAANLCRLAVKHAWRALIAAELALPWRIGAAPLGRQQAAALAAGSLGHLSLIARQAVAFERQTNPGSKRLLVWLLDRYSLAAASVAAWLEPTNYDALLALGMVCTNRGRWRRASRALRRAARLAPERGQAWCWLAFASAKLFRGDWVGIAYDKAIDAGGTLPAPELDRLAEALRALADETDTVRREIDTLPQRLAGVKRVWRTPMGVWIALRLSVRLAGGRRRLIPATSQQVAAMLRERGAAVTQLEQLARVRRAAAERAAQFAAHREDVARRAADPEDRTAELEAVYEAAMKAERRWEAGDAAAALGRVARARGRPADTRRWLETAIAAFTPAHPREIVRRGLTAQLARVLLQQQERTAAFDVARRAVAADPLSSFERNQRADCHFELGEWAAARAQWEESLRVEPDAPGVYLSIALCWFNEGSAAEERARRRECFDRAADNLERALTLYEPERSEQLDCQFLLGRVHDALGDAVGAQRQWRVLESRGYHPLYLGLHLADSLLREVSFGEAEARFRQLAARLETELAGDAARVDQPIDRMSSDQTLTTYGTAAVWANLGIALALARRHVAYGEALRHVERAREVASRIGDPDAKRQWMGTCDQFEGEVRVRQGDLAAALGPLERSLETNPTSDGYFFLATALLAQLDRRADDAAARQTAARVRGLIDLSGKLDRDGLFEERLGELRTRLDGAAAAKAV